MSIAELQACLARIYVNEPFRRLFFRDAREALGGYSLTTNEAEALRLIDRDKLEQFARSLVSKRRKRVEHAYPLLFAFDEAAMRHFFWRFCQLYPARPGQSSSQDLIDFGEFIEETLALAEELPKYAADLARYERLYVRASFAVASVKAPFVDPAPDGDTQRLTANARPYVVAGVEIAEFSFDVSEIEEALRDRRSIEETEVVGASSILFVPDGEAGSGVRMLRVNAATAALIAVCDGTRTLTEIVSMMQSILDTEDLEDGIVHSIDRLVAAGVLSLGARQPAVRRFYTGAALEEAM